MNELENQLNEIYQLCADGGDDHLDKAMELAFAVIEGNFAERNPDAVNDYLGQLDVKRAHHRILVGSLRASSRAQHLLPHWYALLIATQSELDLRGLDTRRLLRGMIQNGVDN